MNKIDKLLNFKWTAVLVAGLFTLKASAEVACKVESPRIGIDSVQQSGVLKQINGLNDPKKRLELALATFQKADGGLDEFTVAGLLEEFKKDGKGSDQVISAIAGRLKENDVLYKNRGPKEVERLRGFMIASLADIGINKSVIPIIKSEIAFGYHPYVVAAASRTAGLVTDDRQQFIQLFNRYFEKGFQDDYVDLDNYGVEWPLKKPTTTRLEIVKTLGKIGGSSDKLALQMLTPVAEAEKGSFFASDTQLVHEAKNAIAMIRSGSSKGDDSNMKMAGMSMHGMSDHQMDHEMHEHMGHDMSKSSHHESIISYAPNQRKAKDLASLKGVDQNGNSFQFNKTIGKPFALTFFYSRCDNPNKCSATVSHVADLQKSLEQEGLDNRVSLFAITLDPDYDASTVIKTYGQERGVNFEDNAKFLTLETGAHSKLMKDLGVAVSYGKGLVNLHGVQLYLFDKQGRLAKVYDDVEWADKEVVNDFRSLLAEK